MTIQAEIGTAMLSECGTYRYSLTREWRGSGKVVAFIGMNPSTADDNTDDPTIRRCINFVQAWGASKLIMVNLFAYRSTDPDVLLRQIKTQGESDALTGGEQNSDALEAASSDANIMVAAWGSKVHCTEQATNTQYNFAETLHALRLNKDGSPAHPLYLPKSLKPKRWVDAETLLDVWPAQ